MRLVFSTSLFGHLTDVVLLSPGFHGTLSGIKREHGDVIFLFFGSHMEYLIRLLCNEHNLLSSDVRAFPTVQMTLKAVLPSEIPFLVG
jgi:hypothetical protein